MKRFLLTFAFGAFGSLVVGLANPQTAFADLGNLISDSTFVNTGSMTEQQIDNFINSFPKSCLIPRNYPAGLSPVTFLEPTSYFDYGGNTSPARVIWKAANLYGISPQVILATLEKEQNLVTGNAGCATWKYNSAMGYNCPDGSENALKDYPNIGIYRTCVARESNAGFSRQVNHAAWQLIFDMNRAYGRTDWGGDGSVYYYGRMTEGWRARVAGGPQSYYDGYVMIDGQAIYLSNGATASLYNYTPHINNFKRIFTSWFGDSDGPAAYKTADSPTIYTNIGGYRVIVPYMAALNDYGISSDSVRTVEQSFVDSFPLPPQTSGLSSEISHVVKSPSDSDEDGGSIYVISVGKRYQFQSMQQFLNFGFKENQIRYLPIQYILTKQSGGMLPNHISSPQGSVFEVSTPSKRLVFEYQTFASRSNPTGYAPMFSYYLIDRIPSGSPIVDRPVMVKYSTGDSVSLYTGSHYYRIPNYEVYTCWGLEKTLQVPVYRVQNNSYLSPIEETSSLSCGNTYSNNSYVLIDGQKVPTPTQPAAIQLNQLPDDLSSLYKRQPSSPATLSRFVTTPGSAAVWVLSGDTRRVIPTYGTFQSIGLTSVNLHTIDPPTLELYRYDGIYLNPGQLIKEENSASVYVVSQNGRHTYATSDLFLAYKNSWHSIDTINSNDLNRNYPSDGNVSPIIVDKDSSQLYAISNTGCFNITNYATSYGVNIEDIKLSQPYSYSTFQNLPKPNSCRTGSIYIKSTNSSLVYEMSEGRKRPINSYSTLLSLGGGKEPLVMNLDSIYVNNIPTGEPR